jgi:hypothetical protein
MFRHERAEHVGIRDEESRVWKATFNGGKNHQQILLRRAFSDVIGGRTTLHAFGANTPLSLKKSSNEMSPA